MSAPRSAKTRSHGFTLIEMLVVISIIGMLCTVVIASLARARLLAQDARRISDIRTLKTAIEAFHLETGRYPCGALWTEFVSTEGLYRNYAWSFDDFAYMTGNANENCPNSPVKTPVSLGIINKTPRDPVNSIQRMYVYETLIDPIRGPQTYIIYGQLEANSSRRMTAVIATSSTKSETESA